MEQITSQNEVIEDLNNGFRKSQKTSYTKDCSAKSNHKRCWFDLNFNQSIIKCDKPSNHPLNYYIHS